MTDWAALSHARNLDIPDDAIAGIVPALDALEKAFRPLVARIPHTIEPAIILSETAVLGE